MKVLSFSIRIVKMGKDTGIVLIAIVIIILGVIAINAVINIAPNGIDKTLFELGLSILGIAVLITILLRHFKP